MRGAISAPMRAPAAHDAEYSLVSDNAWKIRRPADAAAFIVAKRADHERHVEERSAVNW